MSQLSKQDNIGAFDIVKQPETNYFDAGIDQMYIF